MARTLGTVTLPDGEVLTLGEDLNWHSNRAKGHLQEALRFMRTFSFHPARGEPVRRLVNEMAEHLGGTPSVDARMIAPHDPKVVH